jgi:CheY-like chemotaxis protein
MSPPTNRARVLVVDDNPLILDLMRKGLEPLAEIAVCADSADALLQSITSPPDLLICDYRMPGLDGGQLVEKLHQRPETKAARVILLATKSDIDEKLRSVADFVEEFVAKPFFITELFSRTKKVLDRIAAEKSRGRIQAQQEGVIRGRLAEMNMIDLLQSLELGQKTCSLTVTRNSDVCRMFFVSGQLSHAELGSLEGDDAVYGVVSWPEGDFEIDFNSRTDKKTTSRSTQGLLMEALRLLDEQGRDSST